MGRLKHVHFVYELNKSLSTEYHKSTKKRLLYLFDKIAPESEHFKKTSSLIVEFHLFEGESLPNDV